jgi:MtN3 and saliva related transmembrane protein
MIRVFQILGIIAAVLTTISFFPQAYKIWKTNRTDDLSLAMFSLFVIGISLWCIYGFFLRDIAIILANGTTLLICFYILGKKLQHIYQKQRSHQGIKVIEGGKE